jgi:hypothetical protein
MMPPEGEAGTTLMGAEGDKGSQTPTEAPTWMAQLPDDLKTNESLAKYATIGDVSRGLLDLSGKLEGTVRIPGEDATDEDKSSFFNALGRPETAEKYEFTRPTLPEGINYDEAQEGAFRTMAHEIGLSQAQAEKLYGFYHQNILDSYKEYVNTATKAKEEAETELKKEWGDQYNGNLEVAKRAMREFGGEEIAKFMEGSGLGNNPLLVKLFNQIGKAMLEDNLQSGKVKGEEEERPKSLDGSPMLDFPSMKKKQTE